MLGAGVLTTLLIFEDTIVDPVQAEAIEDKPLGKYSHYGDLAGQMIPNAIYVVGMLGYGLVDDSPRALRNSSSMFQATLYSVSVSTFLKAVVREPRPYSMSVRNSFPSGHTTSAFTFASYVGCRHSWPWGIAAYSLAGLVAYSRINDNKHFLHDVAGGATIGTGFGLGICLAENRRRGSSSPLAWYVAPADHGAFAGLNLSY